MGGAIADVVFAPSAATQSDFVPEFLGLKLESSILVQPADIGWPTGNGKKLSNCQACCLAQLCLGAV